MPVWPATAYYRSPEWHRLRRQTKERNHWQCQICGDRKGDPYCQLHAHHVIPRAEGGADALWTLITLCDLCHAVVTRRWFKPWFGFAAIAHRDELEGFRQTFLAFLALPLDERTATQQRMWAILGRQKAA